MERQPIYLDDADAVLSSLVYDRCACCPLSRRNLGLFDGGAGAMSETLFDIPKKQKKQRKPFVKTQRYVCRRCKGSVSDKNGAYCHRFDLCLEFTESGQACLTKDGWPIECNGEEWQH